VKVAAEAARRFLANEPLRHGPAGRIISVADVA
jgi:hypothetical protein